MGCVPSETTQDRVHKPVQSGHVPSGDLALHKTATQSSTLDANIAGRAVDGTIGKKIPGGHCSHTGLHQNQAWWKVDLGDVYRIQTINITYRQAFTTRLYGYYLYVTNHTDMAVDSNGSISTHRGHLCYHDNGSALPNYKQSRHCSINGIYVIFYNKRPVDDTMHPAISDVAYIELCEVQVFGCPVNNFGPDCSSVCHCRTGSCNPDTGHCDVSGCQIGWTGTSCSECTMNHFGPNCSSVCHCSDGGCNPDTGHCDVSGCQSGWTGTSCSVCDTNHFGPGCAKQCHCETEGCNKIDGTCNVTGCQDGWMGKSCDQSKLSCSIRQSASKPGDTGLAGLSLDRLAVTGADGNKHC
ncbi:protein draper-like [Mizuhopecten yessoensis]|uniref:protein draper-like n=1 Tax=Mizuhopecten yessoensis TaxID=6573 RepID=UPI000B4584D3|nr:protein draper-like [Mizuhopecten yessoensis]